MAQPQFVPADPNKVPYYASPPRRGESWQAARPGETVGSSQPAVAGVGSQGPDQGYALHIVGQFEDRLELAEGERLDDVIEGCLGVALRRASLHGRAPVVHDWTVAFTIFGFLDADAPDELVDARRSLFEQVGNHHHYREGRRLVDLVHDEVLAMSPEKVAELGWQSRWTQP